jgi:putative PIN family toxin of toxin-antitoxin system
LRVILDTNVLLSGIISPQGTPARLIHAWLDRRFTLISHALQLDEIREVSRRPKLRGLVKPVEIGRIVNQIMLVAELPDTLPLIERSRDPRDDFLLALCEKGAADWLVTGDKADLLSLERHDRTHIVTTAHFADVLGLKKPL